MFWPKPRFRFVTQHGVYGDAFRKLSRGLWLIFAGWLAMTAGIVGLGVMALLKQRKLPIPGEGVWDAVMMVLLVVGVIANLLGKYKCHDLHQPLALGWRLPGHRWLAGSLWCDVANFLLKWVARGLGMPWIKLLSLPLAVGSMVLFLLFLRKTADIIDRPALKLLANVLLGAMTTLLVIGGGTIACYNAKIHFPIFIVGLLVTLVLAAAVGACYLGLLLLMAMATGEFAQHLADDEYSADETDDYEELGVEQEPA